MLKKKAPHARGDIVAAGHDLENAIAVIRLVRDKALEHHTPEEIYELSGYRKISLGTFVLRMRSAKNYGLVEMVYNSQKKRHDVVISRLGKDVLDPSREHIARVQAFLTVPLYSALLKLYGDNPLPPADEIEQDMVRLGVPPRQTQHARQTFLRSANQAGFFRKGRDRLQIPQDEPQAEHTKDNAQNDVIVATTPEDEMPTAGRDGRAMTVHAVDNPFRGAGNDSLTIGSNVRSIDPALDMWWQKVPSIGETWPRGKRRQWLRILEQLLDYAFEDGGYEDGTETPNSE